MSVDPYNLGPPVYKQDQVITKADLKNTINELMRRSSEYELNAVEAERFDSSIRTLVSLYEWLKAGKRWY